MNSEAVNTRSGAHTIQDHLIYIFQEKYAEFCIMYAAIMDDFCWKFSLPEEFYYKKNKLNSTQCIKS